MNKNSGRQCLISAYQDINLADLVNNVAQSAMDLPVGAVVVDGELVVTEAFNSTTSDVLDVGDASLATRYKTDGNIHATGVVALVPTGFVHTSTQPALTVTWTSGGGTPTTGKVRLQVRYYVENRVEFSQG